MTKPLKKKAPGVWSYLGAFAIGIPVVGIGLLMTLSIVLAPVGIPLILLGSLPFYKVDRRRAAWILADRYKDTPHGDVENAPWN
jgi:hypothetical protein